MENNSGSIVSAKKESFLIADSLEEALGIKVKKDYDDISNPEPIRKIRITKEALEFSFMMAEQMKEAIGETKEVYALLCGNGDLVTDIIIPKQEVTYTHIDVKPENILELKDFIKDNKISILGWIHSHSDFGVFFSGTDTNNQEVLFRETTCYHISEWEGKKIRLKFLYGGTVNTKRDLYGQVTTQFPWGHISTEKDVRYEIVGELPEDWNEKLVREVITSELKQKIEKPFVNNYYNSNWKNYEKDKEDKDKFKDYDNKWYKKKNKNKTLDEDIPFISKKKDEIVVESEKDIKVEGDNKEKSEEDIKIIELSNTDVTKDPYVLNNIGAFLDSLKGLPADDRAYLESKILLFAKFLKQKNDYFP